VNTNVPIAIPNNIGTGLSIYTSGTSVNHFGRAVGALDIGFFPNAGWSPPNFPAIIVRNPNPASSQYVFHARTWSPVSSELAGGSMQVWDNVFNDAWGYVGGQDAKSISVATLAANASAVQIGGLSIPQPYWTSSGVVEMVVNATTSYHSPAASSYWRVRQRYLYNGSSCTLGAVDEIETCDNIGLTTPSMVVSGTYPSFVMNATVYSSTAVQVSYSAVFKTQMEGW